jgi:hypothetical protein
LERNGEEVKKGAAAFLMAILLSGILTQPVAAGEVPEVFSLVFENRVISFAESDDYGLPFTDNNGQTQMPIRRTLEALDIGAIVEYDSPSRTVIVTRGEVVVRFEIDGETYINDAIYYPIDKRATLIDNRAYIPVRYIAEPFGYSADIEWVWADGYYDIIISISESETPPQIWAPPTSGYQLMGLNGELGLVFGGGRYQDEEFVADKFESLYHASISLNHRSTIEGREVDIILEPLHFKYQLFRVTAAGDVLLYSKPFPFFPGGLFPPETHTEFTMIIPYWTRQNISPGAYKVQLECPEYFVYRYVDEETWRYLSIRDNTLWATSEFVVK